MNVAKRVLFIVGGVMSLVSILVFLFLGIFFIAFSTDEEIMQRLADDSAQYGIEYFQGLFLALGVMFFVFLVFSIPNAILSFKGKNSDSKGLMIANIVFGALSGICVNIVAAIFGLILRNKKPKNEAFEEEA